MLPWSGAAWAVSQSVSQAGLFALSEASAVLVVGLNNCPWIMIHTWSNRPMPYGTILFEFRLTKVVAIKGWMLLVDYLQESQPDRSIKTLKCRKGALGQNIRFRVDEETGEFGRIPWLTVWTLQTVRISLVLEILLLPCGFKLTRQWTMNYRKLVTPESILTFILY